jgi:hypothetical protein
MNPFNGWIERRRASRWVKTKARVAQAFNDVYTYGTMHLGSYKWMCPECNRVHESEYYSWIGGLQYPACCSTGPGDRLYVASTKSLRYLKNTEGESCR